MYRQIDRENVYKYEFEGEGWGVADIMEKQWLVDWACWEHATHSRWDWPGLHALLIIFPKLYGYKSGSNMATTPNCKMPRLLPHHQTPIIIIIIINNILQGKWIVFSYGAGQCMNKTRVPDAILRKGSVFRKCFMAEYYYMDEYSMNVYTE